MGDRGHLSNELSGKLLCDILHDDLQYVVLGHLSKENNYEELAYETVKLEISIGDNPYKGDDIPMMVEVIFLSLSPHHLPLRPPLP
jgi:hypothetical protein